jgi:hypothetical protein
MATEHEDKYLVIGMVDLTGTYRTAFLALAVVGALAIPFILGMPKNARSPSDISHALV